jgi:hypothetical protein
VFEIIVVDGGGSKEVGGWWCLMEKNIDYVTVLIPKSYLISSYSRDISGVR